MLPIKIILICAAMIGLATTLFRVSKKKMGLMVAIAWTLLWILIASVALVPDIASFLAHALGVGRGADVIIYGAIVVIFFILFRIMIRLERIERNITTVVQNRALREVKK